MDIGQRLQHEQQKQRCLGTVANNMLGGLGVWERDSGDFNRYRILPS